MRKFKKASPKGPELLLRIENGPPFLHHLLPRQRESAQNCPRRFLPNCEPTLSIPHERLFAEKEYWITSGSRAGLVNDPRYRHQERPKRATEAFFVTRVKQQRVSPDIKIQSVVWEIALPAFPVSCDPCQKARV